MKTAYVTEFVKLLNDIDPSKRRGEVFADFCEMTYCALAKVPCPFEEQREALEKQYMEVVGRYRNKDDVRKMPEMLALTLEAIHTGGIDFLGTVAGEIGALDARLGQYFTPYEISRMMAEINLTGVEQTIEENGFVTVSEPAAGAGGMILAVADKIEGLGFDPSRHLWVEATELSRATYYMGFIQINARGVAGQVVCGNSLTLERFTGAYTVAAPVFMAEHGHPFAKQRAERAAQQEQDAAAKAERLNDLAIAPATGEAVQLGLFDF